MERVMNSKTECNIRQLSIIKVNCRLNEIRGKNSRFRESIMTGFETNRFLAIAVRRISRCESKQELAKRVFNIKIKTFRVIFILSFLLANCYNSTNVNAALASCSVM